MNLAFIEFRDMQGWSPEDDIDGLDTNGQVASEAVNVDFGHGYFRNMKSPIAITLPSNVSAGIVAGYSLLSAKDFTHTTEGDKTFYVLWNNAPQGSLLGTVDTGGLPASVLKIITGDFSSVNPGDGLIADGSYCIVISIDLVAAQIIIDRVLDIPSPQNCYDISVINKLKFYLDNDAVTLYYGNSTDVEIQSKPEEINYNFVNNQLKINLNCDGYSPALAKTVILNLSLQFLESVVYEAGELEYNGWYLCPRWLGVTNSVLSYGRDYLEIGEEFTGGVATLPNSSVELYYGFTMAAFGGSWGLYGYPTIVGDLYNISAYFFEDDGFLPVYKISNLTFIRGIRIYAGLFFDTPTIGSFVAGGARIKIRIRKEGFFSILGFGSKEEIYYTEIQEIDVSAMHDYYFNPSIYPTEENSKYEVVISIKMKAENLKIFISTIGFVGWGSGVIISKNYDGQRALLGTGRMLSSDLQVSDLDLILRETEIDWRIISYEIYLFEYSNIGKLLGRISVNGSWTAGVPAGGYPFSKTALVDEIETSNFNYGLGGTVGVSTQSHIYMETFYRNRVYFVKDDFKVYFSHISGTGRAQPDSFPYDEDVGYGFLETKGATKNKAIAVDVTDSIVIIQEKGLEAYVIEYGTTNVMRKLRVISGETGIGSRKSLLATLNGTPTTTGLIWSDVNGIYIYAGGIAQPTNLTYPSIKKYYNKLDVADKENAVGFYNPILNEYWLQIGSSVLIFEIPYRQFRTRSSALTISSYVGDRDNAIRVLGSASNMFSVASNDASDAYIAGYLTSHYTSGYQLSGQGRMFSSNLSMDKLMQEVYVMFGACAVGQKVTLRFYIDGVLLSDVITILAESHTTAVRLAPLAVKFGKAKLKLTINGTKLVTILSFGFTSDIMSKMLAGSGADVVGTGYGSGYGTDYGDNL
uniref:Uncharacterized protein n=1 Tax=viral metagenome TaxID=1070528 RepID=A0A6H1ZGD1_9ZZZZ